MRYTSSKNTTITKFNQKRFRSSQIEKYPVILRASQRNNFLECPRRYYYGYVAKVESTRTDIQNPPHLSYGTAIHKVLEGFYSLPAERRTLKYLQSKWRECVRENDLDSDYKEMGLYMLENYFYTYNETDSNNFETVCTEKRLYMPVKTPIGEVLLTGQIDGLWFEKNTGKLFVVDHKTYNSFPNDWFFETNGQMYAYFQLLEYNGLLPSGFIFNILRKTAPQKPELNKDGSLSIKNSNISEKKFLDAAKKFNIDLNEERYVKYLASIRDNPLFRRAEFENNREKTKANSKQLKLESIMLLTQYKHGFVPNFGDHCGMCAFKELCDLQNNGATLTNIIKSTDSIRVKGTIIEPD